MTPLTGIVITAAWAIFAVLLIIYITDFFTTKALKKKKKELNEKAVEHTAKAMMHIFSMEMEFRARFSFFPFDYIRVYPTGEVKAAYSDEFRTSQVFQYLELNEYNFMVFKDVLDFRETLQDITEAILLVWESKSEQSVESLLNELNIKVK